MMVSKVAVIALVAVIAVPILLGYSLNLTETTETDYRITGEAVNVTPLLQNGTGHSYAHGDIYQLNTNTRMGSVDTLPTYVKTSSVATSFPLYKLTSNSVNAITNYFSVFDTLYYQVDNYDTAGYINMEVYTVSGGTYTLQYTINRVHTVYYRDGEGISFTYYTNPGDLSTLTYAAANTHSNTWVQFVTTGSFNGGVTVEFSFPNGTTDYVDFSSGFYFSGVPNNWMVKLPNNTKSALMTIDLDSITTANYSIRIGYLGYINLQKVTDGLGNVTWSIINAGDPSDYKVLYYNPSGNNTYQVKMDMDLLGTYSSDPTKNEYQITYDFRYIGKWPTVIGEANYYNDYSITRNTTVPKGTDVSMPHIDFGTTDNSINRSPTIRMDDALFRAFTYDVIEDQTYSPSSFKTNPRTTISNLQHFGTSIEFAGNTYTVSGEGEITIGSHQIPINNLVFSSVPNANGGYDNKIGNTLISSTAQPSTIKFNGQWNASIATVAQESYTYTHTEWNVGSFAWDGMDQSFLIVGLVTCVGVFIGLGIYARKSQSGGIIPLMIVVGAAAMVFFVML